MFDGLKHDFRYSLRALVRNRSIGAISVLSLGLGIGATTTVFSVIDAVDIRPLPYAHPENLVALREITPSTDRWCVKCPWFTSWTTAMDWASQSQLYDAVAVHTDWGFDWQHGDTLEPLDAANVSLDFFRVLGVTPQLGRSFGPSDTIAGADRVALVGDKLWRTRFNSDPRVLGARLTQVDRGALPVTIIGVLPKGFQFADGNTNTIWSLIQPERAGHLGRDTRNVDVVARLRPGVTIAGANAELRTIGRRLAATFPDSYRDWGVTVQPLREFLTSGLRSGRFALLALVALVMLIAVLNVAGLFLAYVMARQHELAVRRAVGASRGRLVRQLVIDGLLVGIAGGLLGIGITAVAVDAAAQWFSLYRTGLVPSVDFRVLAFGTMVGLVAGAASAILPARRAFRTEVRHALADRIAMSARLRTAWTPSALLVCLIAGALVLMTTAGVLTREFLRLQYRELGYDPRALYSWVLRSPSSEQMDGAQLVRRISATPGVEAAAIALPLTLYYGPARPLLGVAVDPTYFRTLGMRLSIGPGFTDRDGTPVAVINMAAASQLWPGQSVLGRRVLLGAGAAREWVTVVGVVANAKLDAAPTQPARPTIYRPLTQVSVGVDQPQWVLYVRITHDSDRVLAAVMTELRDFAHRPQLPPTSIAEWTNRSLLPQRLNAVVLDGFAAFAILLGAIGIYGIVSFAVTQRTREIGTRMALGATPARVIALLARQGAIIALAGVALGLLGFGAFRRVLEAWVDGAAIGDLRMLMGCAIVMLTVALVATCIPVVRAANGSPIAALRRE